MPSRYVVTTLVASGPRAHMPEWLTGTFETGSPLAPLDVLVRLLAAMVFGGGVAFVYVRARGAPNAAPSFTTTLVLLAILIAMVTQVIGDNVARAFSLVGALSIVRFRTVVRDTQDTAYVIFAVAVGMAAGAGNLSVAIMGIAVVGLAAAIMVRRSAQEPDAALPFPLMLEVRIGVEQDVDTLLGSTLDSYVERKQLVSLETGRKGTSLQATYRAELRAGRSSDALVKALNALEGVQGVSLEGVNASEA